MLRQVSSRNQRSKGLKAKKFIQLFLISAVTIWLLYQVKHSYDKKKSYHGSKTISLSSLKEELTNREEVLRFGRKDLPQIDREKEEENNRIINQEMKQIIRDTKNEENYDDEETEEAEAGEEEELEEADETGKDGKDTEIEDPGTFEDEEHERERSREARERSFHGDNVASAVAHETNITWHDDYLESRERNLSSTQQKNRTTKEKVDLTITDGVENKTEIKIDSVVESVNLTSEVGSVLNETTTTTTTTTLVPTSDGKETSNFTIVNNNITLENTRVSLNPASVNASGGGDSHSENKVESDGDVVLE